MVGRSPKEIMGDINLSAENSFSCKACGQKAEIHMENDTLESVRCPKCRAAVRGDAARSMYSELRNRYVIQKGRQLAREAINRTKTLRVPKSKVATQFSDDRWPFLLEVKEIS